MPCVLSCNANLYITIGKGYETPKPQNTSVYWPSFPAVLVREFLAGGLGRYAAPQSFSIFSASAAAPSLQQSLPLRRWQPVQPFSAHRAAPVGQRCSAACRRPFQCPADDQSSSSPPFLAPFSTASSTPSANAK